MTHYGVPQIDDEPEFAPAREHHAPGAHTDRCRCGGQIVHFSDGNADGWEGEGCEVSGRVFAPRSPLFDVDSPDYGRPETCRCDGEDHG